MPEFPPQFWLAGLVAYTAVVGWLWRVQALAQQADRKADALASQQRLDNVEVDKRLEKTEDTAKAVEKVAQSIAHMGDKFATEIKHLADKQDISTEFTKTQLEDIKREIGHVRNNATMARDAAMRKVS